MPAFQPTTVQRRYVAINSVNMTRAEMARTLGISPSTLAKYFGLELQHGKLALPKATAKQTQSSQATKAQQLLDRIRAKYQQKPSGPIGVTGPTGYVGSRTPTGPSYAKPAPAAAKPSNHRARWDNHAQAMLVTQFTNGTPLASIAFNLGRTVYAVLGRLHACGYLTFDRDTKTDDTKPQAYYVVG